MKWTMQCIGLSLLVGPQQGISFNSPIFPEDFSETDHLHLPPSTEEPEELKRMDLTKAGLICMPDLLFFFLLKITEPAKFFFFLSWVEHNNVIWTNVGWQIMSIVSWVVVICTWQGGPQESLEVSFIWQEKDCPRFCLHTKNSETMYSGSPHQEQDDSSGSLLRNVTAEVSAQQTRVVKTTFQSKKTQTNKACNIHSSVRFHMWWK